MQIRVSRKDQGLWLEKPSSNEESTLVQGCHHMTGSNKNQCFKPRKLQSSTWVGKKKALCLCANQDYPCILFCLLPSSTDEMPGSESSELFTGDLWQSFTRESIGPEKKCLVPGNPTDPTFLGPALNFYGTSENFSSVFRVFWTIFTLFPTYIKNLQQKKNCLPTDPIKYWDISGNKTFIFFGLAL